MTGSEVRFGGATVFDGTAAECRDYIRRHGLIGRAVIATTYDETHTKETSRMFQPLGDRILVQRIDSPEKTPGGLFIPDNAREKPCEGRVIAVGPGKRLDDGTRAAMDTSPGDRIMFGKYSGNEIRIEGAEYVILREDDVLGIAGTQATT